MSSPGATKSGLIHLGAGREALVVHVRPGDRALRRERAERLVLVNRADRHALAVARRAADRAGAARVARGEHRHDAERAPGLHHRQEPGVGAVGRDPRSSSHGRVVGRCRVAVRIHHPLRGRDQLAAVAGAVGVQRLRDDQGRAGRHADGGAAVRAAHERAGDVRAVLAVVVRRRAAVHEVLPGPRSCPRGPGSSGRRPFDHADPDALAGDPVRVPDGARARRREIPVALAARLLRCDLVAVVRRLDACVEVDARDVRVGRELRDLRGRRGRRRPP